MSEFIIECWYDFDDGWIAGEHRDEIVRCRDCVWFCEGNEQYAAVDWCKNFGCEIDFDGFCKWGERRSA